MFRRKKTLEEVKEQHKGKVGKVSYNYVILNHEYLELRDKIDKAIKKQELNLDILSKFSKKITEYIEFLDKEKKPLRKENKKLTEKNFEDLRNHLIKTDVWAKQQIALFNDKEEKEKSFK